MSDQLDLGALARELRALESETFEIVDYKEADELLGAGQTVPGWCSTSTCSTCSCCSTTSG